MNLRETKLPLSCEVSKEKVKALFAKEQVATKYRAVMQSAEFKRKLEDVIKSITRLREELEQGEECFEQIKQISSREYIEETVKLSFMINIIAMSAESIIFDDVPADEAVAGEITLEFLLKVLNGAEAIIANDIFKTVMATTISRDLSSLFG